MAQIDIRKHLACVLDTITGWCGTVPYDKHEEDDFVEIDDAEYHTRNKMEVAKNGAD